MYQYPNIWVVYSAVILAIGFIMLSAWYITKLFKENAKDLLVRFILTIFAALVGVFIVDKVIAFNQPLLSLQQNENLFELIKTLTLMIFSYYFGTQKSDKKDES